MSKTISDLIASVCQNGIYTDAAKTIAKGKLGVTILDPSDPYYDVVTLSRFNPKHLTEAQLFLEGIKGRLASPGMIGESEIMKGLALSRISERYSDADLPARARGLMDFVVEALASPDLYMAQHSRDLQLRILLGTNGIEFEDGALSELDLDSYITDLIDHSDRDQSDAYYTLALSSGLVISELKNICNGLHSENEFRSELFKTTLDYMSKGRDPNALFSELLKNLGSLEQLLTVVEARLNERAVPKTDAQTQALSSLRQDLLKIPNELNRRMNLQYLGGDQVDIFKFINPSKRSVGDWKVTLEDPDTQHPESVLAIYQSLEETLKGAAASTQAQTDESSQEPDSRTRSNRRPGGTSSDV